MPLARVIGFLTYQISSVQIIFHNPMFATSAQSCYLRFLTHQKEYLEGSFFSEGITLNMINLSDTINSKVVNLLFIVTFLILIVF